MVEVEGRQLPMVEGKLRTRLTRVDGFTQPRSRELSCSNLQQGVSSVDKALAEVLCTPFVDLLELPLTVEQHVVS